MTVMLPKLPSTRGSLVGDGAQVLSGGTRRQRKDQPCHRASAPTGGETRIFQPWAKFMS
jgi:hypothetical protein